MLQVVAVLLQGEINQLMLQVVAVQGLQSAANASGNGASAQEQRSSDAASNSLFLLLLGRNRLLAMQAVVEGLLLKESGDMIVAHQEA